MPPSGPKPDPGLAAPAGGLPFQWRLLAWAFLVGGATGLAVVGFHELLAFLNDFVYGPFVEWLLEVGRTPLRPPLPDLPAPAQAPVEQAWAPLKALLQLGLGGIGLLPPPPPPQAAPIALPSDFDWLELWPVVVVPTLGGVAVGLLRWLAGELGPGLPSLMAMAEGSLPDAPKLPLLRIVAASLSLGSGASLGPEGPSVESGGNIGLWMALRAGLPAEAQKSLVAAGVAAGLAAGFKAPIAGVIFAFEGSFSSIAVRPSLRAVLIAAIAATLVTEIGLGDAPILRLPDYEVRYLFELPLYLVLGLLASGLSLLLVRLLAMGRSGRMQRWLAVLPPGVATGLGGAAVGFMALAFPQVLGLGYDTIEALLGSDGGIPLLTLLALLGVKLLATGVSNACGFVGGGFAPALVLGAVLGNVYGQLLGQGGLQLPVAAPPAYAMVGMAAVLAGSARAPLTALLLMFELTRDIRIVLPLMAAAGLSAVLMERWQGFVDPGLLGPDPLEERRRTQLAALLVADAFEPEAPLVLPAATPALEALRQLIAAHAHCLLMSEGAQVVGLVTLADLQGALTAAATGDTGLSVRDCLRSDLVWLPMAARLDRLEDQIKARGHRQVPVFSVEETNGDYLPEGAPPSGLPVAALQGMASRDGLSRALARGLQSGGRDSGLISASATGSA
ncbi:MAG: chloride channel protein [Cyanobium sp.]